jgi:hypothetical protein
MRALPTTMDAEPVGGYRTSHCEEHRHQEVLADPSEFHD